MLNAFSAHAQLHFTNHPIIQFQIYRTFSTSALNYYYYIDFERDNTERRVLVQADQAFISYTPDTPDTDFFFSQTAHPFDF